MQYYPACRAGNWFTVEILVHILAAEEFVDILDEYRKKLRRLLKYASLDAMKLVSRPENCISNVISFTSVLGWNQMRFIYLFVLCIFQLYLNGNNYAQVYIDFYLFIYFYSLSSMFLLFHPHFYSKHRMKCVVYDDFHKTT